jgi:choline transport protein
MVREHTDFIPTQSVVPAIAYVVASQIRGIIILLSPSYVPQSWHVCLIMIGLLLFSCMTAILWKRSVPTVAILVAIFHFLLLIAIIATALATETYADSAFVWQNHESLYAGDRPGVSFCVGFVTMAFAFAGWSWTVHSTPKTLTLVSRWRRIRASC